MLSHLPGARAEAERLVVQRAHRTKIDDVARKLVIHAALDEGADFHPLAASRRTQLLYAGDFLAETHTPRAMDAACHVGGDQRPQVLVFDYALALGEARHVAPESQRQV